MTERTKEFKIKLEQLEWIVDYKPPVKELRALIAYYKNEISKNSLLEEKHNHRWVRRGNEINHLEITWNLNNKGDLKHWSAFNLDDLFDFYKYFEEKMGEHNVGVAYIDYYNKELSGKKYLTECNSNNEFLDFVGDFSIAGDEHNNIGIIFEIK